MLSIQTYRNSLTLGIVSKLSLRSLTRSFPFCFAILSNFGRAGRFHVQSTLRSEGAKGKGRSAATLADAPDRSNFAQGNDGLTWIIEEYRIVNCKRIKQSNEPNNSGIMFTFAR